MPHVSSKVMVQPNMDVVHSLSWADLDSEVLRDGIQNELNLLLSRLGPHCDLTAAICTASNTASSPSRPVLPRRQ